MTVNIIEPKPSPPPRKSYTITLTGADVDKIFKAYPTADSMHHTFHNPLREAMMEITASESGREW